MKPNDMIKLNSIPKQSEDIVSRRILDEFLLVPISKTAGDVDSIYTLNEIAAFIWESIDGKLSIENICTRLVEEFDVDIETATRDVLELLRQLKDLGVVSGC